MVREEAEAAARLYTSIFPDSRIDAITPLLSDSPAGPGLRRDRGLHALRPALQAISAGRHDDFNDAISLVVSCADQAELNRYWDALLIGGGRPQGCGWLMDRFGVRWQVVPAALDDMLQDADHARARRVSDAVLKMVKLDIAALKRAYDG
ncbi:MAG: VOC family protein [Vicinamibacterales bacterium]